MIDIKELRGNRAVAECAGLAGMSPAQWYRIEKHGPKTLVVLERVLRALGMEVRVVERGGAVPEVAKAEQSGEVRGAKKAPGDEGRRGRRVGEGVRPGVERGGKSLWDSIESELGEK